MTGPWKVALDVLKEFGFPVFVAIYLLFQITPALDRLTAQLSQVRAAIDRGTDRNAELTTELMRLLLTLPRR